MAKKMNEFFKKMVKAKKSGAKSFTYKGKTYVSKKSKTGMTIYKRKQIGMENVEKAPFYRNLGFSTGNWMLDMVLPAIIVIVILYLIFRKK